MLTFLAAVSRHGPLAQDFEQVLMAKAEACLPLHPDSTARRIWFNTDRTVALAAWCNDLSHPQHVGLIDGDARSAVTLAGYMFGAGKGTLDGLAREVRGMLADGPESKLGDLPGAYALAIARERSVDVFNGVMPLETVHYADGEEMSVVGTRGLLVHLVASDRRTPSYDRESLAAFVGSGHFAAGRTPYTGVRLAPPRGRVNVTPDGCRVTSVDDLLDVMGAGSAPPDDATFDSMTERLLEIATQIGEFGGPIEMGLSGGKDSRVLAAALSASGTEFTLRTGGSPEHPDVVGAREVARTLGMTEDHVVTGPSSSGARSEIEVDILSRTCGTLFRNDGMLNAWGAFTMRQDVAPARQVIGQGGEFYRGGWLKNPANRDGLTPERARTMVFTKLNRPEPMLVPDARQWYADFLDSLLHHQSDRVGLHARMERAFLFTYGWHWAPPGYSRSVVGEHRYYPYCDTQLLRMNYQLPVEARLHEEPHFNMLARLNRDLAYSSFTKYRWGFESYGPSAHRAPDTWADRAPMVKQPADLVNWQKSVGVGDFREEVETVIFGDEAQHGLFEVVDRTALERIFYSREVYSSPNTRMLWNLYAASVMLSNRWIEQPSPSRPISVRTDANWHQVLNLVLRAFENASTWWSGYMEGRAETWRNRVAGDRAAEESEEQRAAAAQRFFDKALDKARTRVSKRIVSDLSAVADATSVDHDRIRAYLSTTSLTGTDLQVADLLDSGAEERLTVALQQTVHGVDAAAHVEAGGSLLADRGPVTEAFQRLPRMVHDLCGTFGLDLAASQEPA